MVVPAHSLQWQSSWSWHPCGEMGGRWSLAAYYMSILMCSVLCQFFLGDRTRHEALTPA